MQEPHQEPHHVCLIPGLLGFSEIGGITYFHHVRELLEDWVRAADAPVVIHNVATSPTASIRGRAARVFEVDPRELEALSSRVQTVVTVATPNYGAPAAAFFNSAMGGQILKMISLATIYTMEYRKLPLSVLLAVGRVITRLDDLVAKPGFWFFPRFEQEYGIGGFRLSRGLGLVLLARCGQRQQSKS